MIVIDTSALMAITVKEAEGSACKAAIAEADHSLIAAPTVTEALIVAHGRGVLEAMRTAIGRIGAEIVPLTEARAIQAADAYRRYGKGWHAASLNYGDSFAYALAMEYACPLLYVGRDFGLTNVRSALDSRD